MTGFALTAEADLDLGTLVQGSRLEVDAAAIHLALQTWRGTWRGNLRLGLDRASFTLRDTADATATLRADIAQALAGLPFRLTDIVISRTADRGWVAAITAEHTSGETVTVTTDLF